MLKKRGQFLEKDMDKWDRFMTFIAEQSKEGSSFISDDPSHYGVLFRHLARPEVNDIAKGLMYDQSTAFLEGIESDPDLNENDLVENAAFVKDMYVEAKAVLDFLKGKEDEDVIIGVDKGNNMVVFPCPESNHVPQEEQHRQPLLAHS